MNGAALADAPEVAGIWWQDSKNSRVCLKSGRYTPGFGHGYQEYIFLRLSAT
jgi:hypothetical protein